METTCKWHLWKNYFHVYIWRGISLNEKSTLTPAHLFCPSIISPEPRFETFLSTTRSGGYGPVLGCSSAPTWPPRMDSVHVCGKRWPVALEMYPHAHGMTLCIECHVTPKSQNSDTDWARFQAADKQCLPLPATGSDCKRFMCVSISISVVP